MVLRVGVIGINGRMGRAIASVLAMDPSVKLSAGADPAAALQHYPSSDDFLVCDHVGLVFKNSDVVIDFSVPSVALECFQCAIDTKVPLVSGTTGIPKSDFDSYAKLAASAVPIVYSSNMSIGVNVLLNLVKMAAKALDSDFDIEIFERHHAEKVDAPSGTTLSIGKALADVREVEFSYNQDRSGKRKKGSIGVAVSRGGGVFGDHDVSFVSSNEMVTISHRAMGRSAFANGAVKAAKWVIKADPGLYSISDVLGL